MRVLVLLWTGEPLNLSAVAEGWVSTPPTPVGRSIAWSRRVSSIVANGRQTGDNVTLTLTDRGRGFVEQLMERREQELATIVARMSDSDRRRLMTALEPFNEAATADL